MGVSKTEAKAYAKILYVEQRLTQREVAERVGVPEKTIVKWVETDSWEKLRQSLLITKPHNIQLMYATLTKMNEDMQGRIPSLAELNAVSKITTDIKKLETEMGIGEMFTVGNAFINYVRKIDIDKAREVYTLFDAFINSRI